MSFDRTLAIMDRIVRQIVKDRGSLVLIIVAPTIVMSLVGFSFSDQRDVLDRIAPGLLAVFVLFFTFILTGVSFLRERSYGTLERLLTTPVGRGDILIGYMLGFLIFTTAQSLVILVFTLKALQIEYHGKIFEIFIPLFLLVVVAVSLGIFISTFAHNEFQVVQFIPIVMAPQIFLSGVIVPVENMPWALEKLSAILPLTYAVDGLREIMLNGKGLGDVLLDLIVLAGFGAVLLTGAAVTIRRT